MNCNYYPYKTNNKSIYNAYWCDSLNSYSSADSGSKSSYDSGINSRTLKNKYTKPNDYDIIDNSSQFSKPKSKSKNKKNYNKDYTSVNSDEINNIIKEINKEQENKSYQISEEEMFTDKMDCIDNLNRIQTNEWKPISCNTKYNKNINNDNIKQIITESIKEQFNQIQEDNDKLKETEELHKQIQELKELNNKQTLFNDNTKLILLGVAVGAGLVILYNSYFKK